MGGMDTFLMRYLLTLLTSLPPCWGLQPLTAKPAHFQKSNLGNKALPLPSFYFPFSDTDQKSKPCLSWYPCVLPLPSLSPFFPLPHSPPIQTFHSDLPCFLVLKLRMKNFLSSSDPSLPSSWWHLQLVCFLFSLKPWKLFLKFPSGSPSRFIHLQDCEPTKRIQ